MTRSPFDGLGLKLPPSNLQAEQALLGAMLANNKAYDAVAGWLRAEHFADPVNGRIYEAAARRIDAGQLADVLTLKAEFEHSGILEEVGGVAYLAELLSAMVGIINAGEYGRAVRDAWHRRELIEIGQELVGSAYAPGEADARAIHEAAEERLAALADGQEGEAAPVPAHEAMALAIDEAWRARDVPGGLVGLTTGLRALDDATGGLRAPDFSLIGARPSMGKTTLALGIAAAAAEAGARVLFVTLEMSATDLGAQLTAGLTPVSRNLTVRGKERERDDIGRFRWRPMTQGECDAMLAVQRAMASRKLLLLGLRSKTVPALRAAVRRLRRRGGLDLVVIDYVQLMTVPALAEMNNRTLEMTRISAGLKAMAQDFHMPVLALSQLTRAGEGRAVKRPELQDLRDSGALEQDADVVMFLQRDEYYLSRMKLERQEKEDGESFANRVDRHNQKLQAAAGRADLYIDKLRKGAIGTVTVAYDSNTTWFSNLPDEVAG